MTNNFDANVCEFDVWLKLTAAAVDELVAVVVVDEFDVRLTDKFNGAEPSSSVPNGIDDLVDKFIMLVSILFDLGQES